TTARTGKLIRGQFAAPDEIMPKLAEGSTKGAVALVFGPEPNGLTDEEITRCHYLIHIPADPGYPALNLAQAVAICVYELRRAWLTRSGSPVLTAPAPFAEQERTLATWRTALAEIHFLYGPKSG